MSTGGSSTGGTGGSGGGSALPPYCRNTCKTAADCESPGTPTFSADNFACTAGVCEYKGCNSNQECIDTYKTPNWACNADGAVPYKVCHNTCKTAVDCESPGTPTFSADNFACTAGVCEYKGCNSNQECIDTYKTPNWACNADGALPYKVCHNTCKTAVDCESPGTPTFSADNFACTAGICEYKGCNSAQECIDTYKAPNWTCQ